MGYRKTYQLLHSKELYAFDWWQVNESQLLIKLTFWRTSYNTCYCNRIAPGETNRTCRQVGAHKKEVSPQGKTPARLEYDKAYNRLKTQKARGKISLDEWNQRVAKAQVIKDSAERGKLSDRDMREQLGRI